MRDVLSACRERAGCLDMSRDDEVAVEKIVRHHVRKGVFEHT